MSSSSMSDVLVRGG